MKLIKPDKKNISGKDLRRKILPAAVGCVIAAAVIAGIIFGIRKSVTGGKIMVVSVKELMDYGYGYGDETESMEGEVFSGAAQSIYLSGSKTVKEVRVKEGQKVRKGDVLLVYDTEQAQLNVKKEEISLGKRQIALEIAERNLRTLRAIKPVSDYNGGDYGGEEGGAPDDDSDKKDRKKPAKKRKKKKPEKPDNPYKNAQAAGGLTDQSKAYNDNKNEKNLGSEDNPYRFLCTDEAVIYPSFIRMLRKKAAGRTLYFTVEVRAGGKGGGALKKMWLQDASLLADVPDSWRGTLQFADKGEKEDDSGSGESGSGESGSGDSGSGDSGSGDSGSGDSGSGDSGSGDSGSGDSGSGDSGSGDSGSGDSGSDDSGSGDSGSGDSGSGGSGSGDSGAAGTADVSGRSPYRVILLAGDMDDAEEEDVDDGFEGGQSLISSDAEYTKEELAEEIIGTTQTIRDLQLDIREAQLKLRKAKQALEDGEARAAADGVVMTVGNPKHPPQDGSAFLQIGAVKGFSVRGGVSERELDKIHKGSVIKVTSWQSGAELTAVVDDISPYPDTTGTFMNSDNTASVYPFTANIREKSSELEEGEWVELRLVRSGPDGAEDEEPGAGEEADEEENGAADGSVWLMKAFVRSDGDKKYVYRRDKNKKLKKTYVTVGKNTGYAYEILSGLSKDDWVAFPYGRHTETGAKTRKGSMSELEEM